MKQPRVVRIEDKFSQDEIPAGLQDFVATHMTSVRMVPITQLDQNPGQPPTRADSGIENLAHDILHTKLMVSVVVKKQGARFVIIDGHRRTHAAKLLLLAEVPVQVIDSPLPPTLLWTYLNRSMKNISSAHYFFCWGAEPHENRHAVLANCPSNTRKNIQAMMDIFGEDAAATYADGKLSPHIATFINLTQNLMVGKSLPPLPLDQIGRWLITHAQTGVVNGLSRNPATKKPKILALRQAILQNRSVDKVKPAPRKRV